MLLSLNSRNEDTKPDLNSITDSNAESHVPAGRVLSDLVDAALLHPDRLPDARRAVVASLGPQGLIDAAGVIGNFTRMVRIADGTGIPLDTPVAGFSSTLREQMGLNDLPHAHLTLEREAAS
jgi:hypothetical protein